MVDGSRGEEASVGGGDEESGRKGSCHTHTHTHTYTLKVADVITLGRSRREYSCQEDDDDDVRCPCIVMLD